MVFKSIHYPNECVAVCRGSPLIIGIKSDRIRSNQARVVNGRGIKVFPALGRASYFISVVVSAFQSPPTKTPLWRGPSAILKVPQVMCCLVVGTS